MIPFEAMNKTRLRDYLYLPRQYSNQRVHRRFLRAYEMSNNKHAGMTELLSPLPANNILHPGLAMEILKEQYRQRFAPPSQLVGISPGFFTTSMLNPNVWSGGIATLPNSFTPVFRQPAQQQSLLNQFNNQLQRFLTSSTGSQF